MSNSDFLEKTKFKLGDIIFHEGDDGDAAYMVTKGEVEIRLGLHGGNSRTLTKIQKGGTFGELALCLDSPRTASAIATEDTELIKVSRDDLLRILEETNPIVKTLMLNLGKRVIDITEELEIGSNEINWHQWERKEEYK